MPIIDLTDKTFNSWTVIRQHGKTPYGSITWWCRCVCGFKKALDGQSLRRKTTQSCGCLSRGRFTTRGETKGGSFSPEYVSFHSAKGRCRNPKNQKYASYGGRGIEFRFESFEQFLNSLGRKPSASHTLDRIDNNGHYEVGNVRWALPVTQSNNRRNSVSITIDGATHSLAEWARIMGIRKATLSSRIYIYNWCHKCAVTLPVTEGIRQCCHHVRTN